MSISQSRLDLQCAKTFIKSLYATSFRSSIGKYDLGRYVDIIDEVIKNINRCRSKCIDSDKISLSVSFKISRLYAPNATEIDVSGNQNIHAIIAPKVKKLIANDSTLVYLDAPKIIDAEVSGVKMLYFHSYSVTNLICEDSIMKTIFAPNAKRIICNHSPGLEKIFAPVASITAKSCDKLVIHRNSCPLHMSEHPSCGNLRAADRIKGLEKRLKWN